MLNTFFLGLKSGSSQANIQVTPKQVTPPPQQPEHIPEKLDDDPFSSAPFSLPKTTKKSGGKA
jgi:hypothetical protein